LKAFKPKHPKKQERMTTYKDLKEAAIARDTEERREGAIGSEEALKHIRDKEGRTLKKVPLKTKEEGPKRTSTIRL
jgi:hypothetical protein